MDFKKRLSPCVFLFSENRLPLPPETLKQCVYPVRTLRYTCQANHHQQKLFQELSVSWKLACKTTKFRSIQNKAREFIVHEERSKFRIKWWSGFGLVLCAGNGLWHFSHTFAAQPLPCLCSPFVQPHFWTRGARSRTLLPNSPVTAKPRKMWCATRLLHNIITH